MLMLLRSVTSFKRRLASLTNGATVPRERVLFKGSDHNGGHYKSSIMPTALSRRLNAEGCKRAKIGEGSSSKRAEYKSDACNGF